MYGLRVISKSLSLGTTCDFFVPDGDMPSDDNSRGYEVFRDIIDTPAGQSWVYDKGKRKRWDLKFESVETRTKEFFEHFDHGWLGKQQITIVFFGTSVTGTTQSPGTYSAGQLWGTGILQITNMPRELSFDLWDFTVTITEFGTNQIFY